MTDVTAVLDTGRAHSARRYDYWLGGKDNFQADRDSGDAIASAIPWIRDAARENRWFLQRTVRFLARDAGIRQFLDIGTGLPTADNTHQVAQGIAPESGILYVDNDPIVLTHARALLTSTAEGRTGYIDADLRDPSTILDAAELRKILDLGQPVALLLLAVLHFLPNDEHALDVVQGLLDALPTGSYLVLSHAASDLLTPADQEKVAVMSAPGSPHGPFRMRPRDQIERFAATLELIDPGLVPVQRWRPDPNAELRPDNEVGMYGFVARKAN
jgi:hypothetical protein